jgi:hypothetical protein
LPRIHQPRPTPFNRACHIALEQKEDATRAAALAGVAARLSGSLIKQSLLGEACRSARLIENQRRRGDTLALIASQYPRERQDDYLEEAGRLAVVPPALAPEPSCDEGKYRGNFVMLQQSMRHALGYLPLFDFGW